MHIYIYTYIHIYIHIYTYTHTHIHTYMCIINHKGGVSLFYWLHVRNNKELGKTELSTFWLFIQRENKGFGQN